MSLRSELDQRGIEIHGKSDAGRKIENFEQKKISDTVFDVISENQSFRFVFNYLVKAGSFGDTTDTASLEDELVKQLKKRRIIDESFLREASCHCGQKVRMSVWEQEDRRCSNCGSFVGEGDPTFSSVGREHIQNLLGYLESQNVLTTQIIARCKYCSNIDPVAPDKEKSQEELFCSDCDEFMRVDFFHGFTDDSLSSMAGQGYWLEWYVKELLSQEFQTADIDNSREYSLADSPRRNELDVIMRIPTGDIVTIACYDTHSSADASKVNEVLKYKEFSDVIVFVTTGKVNESSCQHIFDSSSTPIIVVNGTQIEEIGTLIRERLTENFVGYLREGDIDNLSTYMYLYRFSYPEEEQQSLLESAIEVVEEEGVEEILTPLTDINYSEKDYFPVKLVENLDAHHLVENTNTWESFLSSRRWERSIVGMHALAESFNDLPSGNQEYLLNHLPELADHRSVYVRNETPKVIKKIYNFVDDSQKQQLEDILVHVEEDDSYPASTAAAVKESLIK